MMTEQQVAIGAVFGPQPPRGFEQLAVEALQETSFSAGHADCEFIRFGSKELGKWIIKLATSEAALTELENNLNGYGRMIDHNISAVIPASVLEINGNDVYGIILPDLGKTIAERAIAGAISDHNIQTLTSRFIDLRDTPVPNLIQDDAENDDFSEKLTFLTTGLVELGELSADTLNSYRDLLTNDAATKHQGDQPQIFDFTSDNLFLNEDESLTFIDPWPQKSYAGSFYVSIGQFLTLASEVYEHDAFITHGSSIAGTLIETAGSDQQVLEAQRDFTKGRIMQLSLSSSVRQNAEDPAVRGRARQYAVNAEAAIKQIIGGTF